MALHHRWLALGGALTAAVFMPAPASAADPGPALPARSATVFEGFGASRFDPLASNAEWHCRGWRCGRRGWRGGWRRNRIDAGDVLIGAAILGGAIAIANANNRRNDERDVVIVERDRVWDRDWRDERRYDDRRDDRRFYDRRGVRGEAGAGGLDSAVDQCLAAIERDVRVDSVDDVSRTGAGWLVSGALFNGAPFRCRIGNDGRIEEIDYGGFGRTGFDASAPPAEAYAPAPMMTNAPRADGQWSDARYANARLALGQPGSTVGGPQATPAYPGGPLPGESFPDEPARVADDTPF